LLFAIALSNRNNPATVAPANPDDHHHSPAQKPDRANPRFAIVLARIREIEMRPSPDQPRVHKIKLAMFERPSTLERVIVELHRLSVTPKSGWVESFLTRQKEADFGRNKPTATALKRQGGEITPDAPSRAALIAQPRPDTPWLVGVPFSDSCPNDHPTLTIARMGVRPGDKDIEQDERAARHQHDAAQAALCATAVKEWNRLMERTGRSAQTAAAPADHALRLDPEAELHRLPTLAAIRATGAADP
jgi:hypothetical protein